MVSKSGRDKCSDSSPSIANYILHFFGDIFPELTNTQLEEIFPVKTDKHNHVQHHYETRNLSCNR